MWCFYIFDYPEKNILGGFPNSCFAPGWKSTLLDDKELTFGNLPRCIPSPSHTLQAPFNVGQGGFQRVLKHISVSSLWCVITLNQSLHFPAQFSGFCQWFKEISQILLHTRCCAPFPPYILLNLPNKTREITSVVVYSQCFWCIRRVTQLSPQSVSEHLHHLKKKPCTS